MTRKLTRAEAETQALAAGYEMVHYAGSSNAYGSIFKCSCGETWSAKHNNVVSSNRTGCPKCAKAKSKLDKDGVWALVSAVGSELVEIVGPVVGQRTKVRVKCSSGHVREAKLGTVAYAKLPCPDCRKAERGVDLAGLNARLVDKGYTIIDFPAGTRGKGEIRCACGTVWQARINSVLQGQSNCPMCSDYGFKKDRPATFYVYELHLGRKVRYGYGVTNDFDRRDKEHRRNAAVEGWKISLRNRFESKGSAVLEVESKAKAVFKAPGDMLCGFKTEAVFQRDLTALLQLAKTLL